MPTATWNGAVIAEAREDEVEIVENNVYFPMSAVKQEYLQRLQAATASDKERIADEANNALTRAVEDQGLTVEEYNSIIVVAQNDPGVREKILQRLRPAGQDQEQPGPHQ